MDKIGYNRLARYGAEAFAIRVLEGDVRHGFNYTAKHDFAVAEKAFYTRCYHNSHTLNCGNIAVHICPEFYNRLFSTKCPKCVAWENMAINYLSVCKQLADEFDF